MQKNGQKPGREGFSARGNDFRFLMESQEGKRKKEDK